MVDCLICSGDSFLIKPLEKTSIFKCISCGLEFANPMPSEEELKEFYTDYRYYSQYDREMITNAVGKNVERNIRHLGKYGLTRESRLLDFGCGDNLFVKQGHSRNGVGYDYPKQNIPEGKFDFITLWGVLEHLSNPMEIVRSLVPKLKDKGKIVMTTVSTETGIPYRYRVPVHLVWWSRKSIKELFVRTGIELKEISNYYTIQNPEFYLDRILDRGMVPDEIKKMISINTKEDILVPTNEILVVGERGNNESNADDPAE